MFESNFEKRKVFDLDLGFSYHPMRQVSLAVVGENLLRAKFTPDDLYSEHLSRKFRFAGAYHVPVADHSLSFLAGWQLEQGGETDINNTSLFNVGTECWLGTHNNVSLGLRGGYIFGKTTVGDIEMDYDRWCAGLSLNFDLHGRDLRVDYAIRAYPFDTDETLTADNFFSISYGWGGIPDYFGGKETNKTYDLTRYQESQTWQTPAAVENNMSQETPMPVEDKPAIFGPEPAPTDEPLFAQDVMKEEPVLAQTIMNDEPILIEEPEPVMETETPPLPKPAEIPEEVTFGKLNLRLDATQMMAGNMPKIIFSLTPDGLLNISSWKLYVFSAKVKKWNSAVVDEYAMAVIKGKGVTPLSIIWDGTLDKGGRIQSGKYYFVVMGVDNYGNSYKSGWHKFKVQ
jgi:hypothetical protein